MADVRRGLIIVNTGAVILTGRNAHRTIVELADTVTEMRPAKLAYEKGVMAQRGIEY